MATFEEIKAKLAAKKNGGRAEGQQRSGGDNASYPFWNIPEDSSALVRFLPDADPDNTFFWVQREVIRLPFQGVVGGDRPTDKEVTVTVPCVDMFGMTCPIIAATRPWWKGDEDQKALARKYWKKKSYIFQGFVVSSPFEEENVPENPIRRFVINPSIYEIIEKSLINPEMEDLPIDYVGGRDFKIMKTRKGDYANYSTSSWSMRTRSLNEGEMAAIEKYGLHDLKQALGRVPDADELDAIKAMFELSVAGEPFDVEAFGKWYKPYGNRDDNDTAASAVTSAARPAAQVSRPAAPVMEDVAPVAETAPAVTSGKPNPQDILDRIRQRTGK